MEKEAISTGQKNGWEQGCVVKGQTWAALQSMRGILTDFEPLKLSLIAHNSDAEQRKNCFRKLALFWLLFFVSIYGLQTHFEFRANWTC